MAEAVIDKGATGFTTFDVVNVAADDGINVEAADDGLTNGVVEANTVAGGEESTVDEMVVDEVAAI